MPVNRITDMSNDVRSAIRDDIEQNEAFATLVNTHIDKQLQHWRSESAKLLTANNPFASDYKELHAWTQSFNDTHPLTIDSLEVATTNFLEFCHRVKRPANEAFWRKQLDRHKTRTNDPKTPANLSMDAKLLRQEWLKVIDQSLVEWELDILSARRAELITQLKALINLFSEISHHLQNLGLEPGVFFDLSMGELSAKHIQQFKTWAKYLSEDEGVRALCDVLGKMRDLEVSERVERLARNKKVQIRTPKIDSREEIIGIRLGRELEHALPSELALLSEPDTTLLFDLKYVESRIMSFEMQGASMDSKTITIEDDMQTCEKEKQGPMIICIDTSGSMAGTPESIAKAVALFLASKARAQDRRCYLINFSTHLETIEIGQFASLATLLSFLQMSFHGGTDATPAISHALQVMKRDAYENADLLIISDFVMADLDPHLYNEIKTQRQSGNKFHSLVINSMFMTKRMQTLFDQEWIFNPATSRVHELIRFQEKLDKD